MTFIVGTPHTHNAGYLLNNQNFATAKREEADIRTCTHCQAVIKMQEWKEDGAWCGKCNTPVCSGGACGRYFEHHGCRPYLKFLEQLIGDEYQLQQFRRLAGLDAQPADYQPLVMTGIR